jgi:hypothetical protein
MKTNSTLLRYAILFIVLLSFNAQAKADSPGFGLNFNSVPTLISGTPLAVGAKYKFNNVASGTDALVTIVSATGGATVDILDDNTTTKPEAFSPKIKVLGLSTGMVEFKIEFVNGGGNPRIIDTLRATAMDIDGNASLHEMDALDMGPASLLSYLTSTLQLNVVQTLNQFLATNVAGIEYDGVDTAAKSVMFTLAKNNISSFTYKAGAINLATFATSRQKGIYFKGFNYVAPTSLPVKYFSFGAVAVNKTVVLNWITEQEIDNKYFEVERSFDGNNFTVAGMVVDGFENGTKKNYQFKDNDPSLESKSIAYYRLKQVDNNGKFSYTNILVVRFQPKNNVVIQTNPNPFVETVSVGFVSTTTGNAEINILSMGGQKMFSKQSPVSKGYNTFQLSGLGKLAPGMYIAQLTMNGIVTDTQKIIKN